MSNNSWIPDIVVGVDFGMTCTGEVCAWPRKTTLSLTFKCYRCGIFFGSRLARTKSNPTLVGKIR